jgi:acetyl/propionyl-CoA carboxylase alpha subunit
LALKDTVPAKVVRIADGMYSVETDGRAEIVYVAGPAGRRSVWWNGRLYLEPAEQARESSTRPGVHAAEQVLTAPMPATVMKVLAVEGAAVNKGDTLVILEAMKMELPVRALAAGIVRKVSCREGELVAPDTPLVEIATGGAGE